MAARVGKLPSGFTNVEAAATGREAKAGASVRPGDREQHPAAVAHELLNGRKRAAAIAERRALFFNYFFYTVHYNNTASGRERREADLYYLYFWNFRPFAVVVRQGLSRRFVS